MVLVQLRVHRGDLPLAESVVERLVDGLRRDAHAGSCDAIDDQGSGQAGSLLIGGEVAQFRNGREFGHKLRRPEIEFLQVGIFQRVLILRAADAVLYGQVLHRLHVQRDAVDFLELRLQPPDHIGRVDATLVQRLQINLDAPAIQRRVGSVDANEGRDALDGGILQDGVDQLLLALRHRGERDRLRRFGNALDDAGVLNGEKTLRHDDVEENREDQGGYGHSQCGGLMFQHPLQRTAIERDGTLEGAFRNFIEAALLLSVRVLQQARTHHRCKGERDHSGNQNRDAEGDGEFAEEPPDDIAHE